MKAAFVGESAEIDKRIIEGTAEIDLLYRSPESFGMFSNDFFRRNTVAVQGSKFIFGFGSTCATRCKFLGALPKF